MDVRGFVSELLRVLATVEAIERVALRSEGPVVNGRAYVTAEMLSSTLTRRRGLWLLL
jgi:alpha-D-ribose 1-methylphosphonate 5-triphosphate synthase subunit PhnL